VGGAQVRFAALANRFGPRWRHVIISLNGDMACAERLGREVERELVAVVPRPGDSLPRRLWAIRGLLRRFRPDVLVTGNWGSIEWAMANLAPPRTRHLHTEDGFGPEEATRQIPRRVLTRRLTLRRSTVILPSVQLLRLAEAEWRLPPERLRHVPNGLDLGRFSTRGPAAPIPVKGDGPPDRHGGGAASGKGAGPAAPGLRHAGRRGKGVSPRHHRRWGGARGLERLAAQLGLQGRVTFTGHLPEPSDAYRALDIFALSSSTEQMPFSILEAMATGLPIAATDVGDVRFMVSPDNQPYLAESGEDGALAAALRTLLDDAALCARLGLANRRRVEAEYDQETMFQAYASLIDGEGLARSS
jgi:glycosyltransferase involved in cell wall biosynthesis